MSTELLWLGGLTATSVRAVAKLNLSSSSVKLACFAPDGYVIRSEPATTIGNWVKLEVTGLTPNTAYTCRVEPGIAPATGYTGSFTTLPSGSNVNFTCALIGDALEGSNTTVFDAVRTSGARWLMHMGDMHYRNLAINDIAAFRAAIEEVHSNSRQARLYQNMPLAWVWDDHDYGPNNSDGESISHDAACLHYRQLFPHYDLVDATVTAPIHQTWDIGRVRFILTDQRSAASPRANTDNSSKTMLGASQKTWFKNLIQNSPNKCIVWICSRHFGPAASAGADHWGGFTTERTELVDHIKTHASGRVIMISADMHAMRIGSYDFATGGGEPIPCFNVATLNHGTIDNSGYGGIGAAGATRWVAQNGIFATMQVTDSGESSITITWRGFNSSGSSLFAEHSFSVTI